MMDGEGSQGIKKVHFWDSSSQVPPPLITYKRRLLQKPQPQQSEPQQQVKPQPEPESEPEPEHKAGDVPAQQSKDIFWKSRDMGWKYGIMIDENRQHWKCMYCGLIRYGGGVSRLKRHLAGDLDVKMCPKVPADVVEEIREHLRKKRERRRKRTAQNGGNSVKTKSFSDDANVEEDLLPSDSVLPAGMSSDVLEEVTNQTSMVDQDPTYPRVPILRARDIGWEHAVDLDGNKRRWQCKFCSLCRSGGVTTLKAHLIDDSCPNVPKEISKKVSNFIEEKRATRLLLNNYIFSVDEDEVSDTQVEGDWTVKYKNDQQPSRNANEYANEMAAGSNQYDQPVEHCDQPEEQWALDDGRMDQVIDSKNKTLDNNADNSQKTKMEAGSSQCGEDSSGQPVEHCDQSEEQWALDQGRMDQVINSKNKILDKNADNSQKTKVHNYPARLRVSAWEHSLIYDKENGHWKCKWCGVEGYHGVSRLKWHLVGWQNLPQCPDVPKDVAKKIRDQMMSKEKNKATRSGSFVGNVSCDVMCSSKSSQLDQDHLTAAMHARCSSVAFGQANSESKACKMSSNTTLISQESANPLVCHEQQRKEVATPSEPGRGQGQMMQWQSQHKV